MEIQINQVNKDKFKVFIEGKINTYHLVTLNDYTYKKITNGKKTKEELILYSFKFLLKKESNTSILSEFELETINNYFPEYELNIKNWLNLN